MINSSALCKSFGSVQALDHISLQVPKGSIYGLVGSNGAGKSTLLRTIAGVFRPDSGSLLVEGQTPYEAPQVKARLFFLPDSLYAPTGFTPKRLRNFYAPLYPDWDEDFYRSLCKSFCLEPGKRLGELSKGMRRLAFIACALATRPHLLLLDEVFDGLDPAVRRLVRQALVGEVAERQMTLVLSTHNLRELEDFCDHLALLHKGQLCLQEELDHLRATLHRIQGVFPPQLSLQQIKEGLDTLSIHQSGGLVTLTLRGRLEELMEQLHRHSPTLLEPVPLSLDELFISEMEAAGYEIH